MDPRLPQPTQGDQQWSQTLAAKANIFQVYEEAVQDPLLECVNIDALYHDAQLEHSPVPVARLLREDFCSSAVVARTWLSLDPRNSSQGVDIDLDALRDTRSRIEREAARHKAIIVQSPAYASSHDALGRELADESPVSDKAAIEDSSQDQCTHRKGSTWDVGAASDRFERRFQARLAKDKAKCEKKAVAAASGKTIPQFTEQEPVLLLHSDVQDLPFSYLPLSKPEPVAVPSPDVIAAFNYALCYFHDRGSLLSYLRVCRSTLKPGTGVFCCDLFAGPPTGETYEDQEALWTRFEKEPGFVRPSDALRPNGDAGELRPDWKGAQGKGEIRVVGPPASESHRNTCAEWPKGKLKLVRTGEENGGFEYWREDGPIDYLTNRFRMSLSFRFRDGSWLRDFFSYDFRIWSLKEVLEAMEEAGFIRVSVQVVPRNENDDEEEAKELSDHDRDANSSAAELDADEDDQDDEGFAGFADLVLKTEKEEAARASYKDVNPKGKLFATRSLSGKRDLTPCLVYLLTFQSLCSLYCWMRAT